ncbi:DUF5641 domain-containing protein [Trichonephila clavipes]|uniref:DUF5641 domain-containing protein n=1 Tax=Trichonephila clavipes TaxID=2585209 RepID=A0A8X6SJF1_TRICX|nr:DUF5641 domain-containing protein [Trichonephila clavipes]
MAIHLEAVTDLTTVAFIAALKRLCARRGRISTLMSDNATNFKGAAAELNRFIKLICNKNETFANYFASEAIQWKFISPRSPNFGAEKQVAVREKNVAVGCLVLLKENDLLPCKWAMERILEVIYGTDGKDEVEKLAYQLNEEAERTERPIRKLSKVMYGSTCADMQVDVMGECLSSIKHVVGVRSVFLAKRLPAV